MELVISIIVILFGFYLNSRINKLERLLQLQTKPAVPAAEVSQVAKPSNDLKPIPLASNVPTASLAEPSPIEELVAWIKEDFLMKLGAGLLLLALGWFVSYAFANNWIGPVGRITLGLLVSTLVMVAGVWRMRWYPQQGSVLVCLGSAGVLMTLFAARELYDMFTPALALGLSFMTAVFVAFVSVTYNRRPLAYAGLILGSIAPLLTNVDQPDALMFFLYLLLVASGTLWVVWRTGWTGLILASLLITGGYSLTFLLDAVGDKNIAVVFSFLFVALYYVANIVSLIRRRAEGTHHMAIHAAVAGGTALFLFAWVQIGVDSQWHSLLYVAWSMVFVLGAYVVYTFTANYAAFYVYGGTSVALLALATAAELDGAALVIAYTLELTAVLVALRQLLPIRSVLARSSILFAVPIILSIEYIEYRSWDTVFGLEFATIALLAAATGLVAWLLQTLSVAEPEGDHEEHDINIMNICFIVLSMSYAALIVWNVSHLLFVGIGTAVALVLYALVGVVLVVTGQAMDRGVQKVVGACFIGFVVARLLLIEVWNMPIELRIIAFVVIGILLVSTAFIGKKVINQHDDVQA